MYGEDCGILDSFVVTLLVGTALGFLTGLGVGGGSLLMVWLTAVLGVEAATARSINLLFFLPGAAVAIFFRKRQGKIQWRNILPPALAGCIAAAVCSSFSTAVENSWLQKIFGGILIIAGLREVLWKPRRRGEHRSSAR